MTLSTSQPLESTTVQLPSRPRVDPQTAASVRELFEDRLLRGDSPAELREVRASLAATASITEHQVRAITAWVRIDINRARAAGGEPAKSLSDVEILTILRAYRSGESAEEISAKYKSDPSLKAAVARMDPKAQKPTTSEISGEDKDRSESTPHVEVTSGGISGTFTNYDFPAKEAWRVAWQDFLGRAFTREELSRAKVLCLPSVEPYREVRHYLSLGIPAENIFAVEGATGSAREQFLKNAGDLGINPLCGRLENIVPQLNERFDIISLDFPGQYCSTYENILAGVPFAFKSALLLNLMAGREHRSTADKLRLCTVDSSSEGYARMLEALRTPATHGTDQLKETMQQFMEKSDRVSEGIELSEARGETGLHILRRLMGLDRLDLRSPFQRSYINSVTPAVPGVLTNSQDGEDERLHAIVRHSDSMYICSMADAIEQILAPYRTGSAEFPIVPLLFSSIHAIPVTVTAESHDYKSEASGSGRPYVSSFSLQVLPDESTALGWKQTAQFGRDCLKAGWLSPKSHPSAPNLRTVRLDLAGYPSLTKLARFGAFVDERRCGELNVVKLREELLRFSDWQRGLVAKFRLAHSAAT